VGLAAPLIRLAYAALGREDLTAGVLIAAGRLILASLLMAPWLARAQPWTAPFRPRMQAALAGVFLALHFALWIASLAFTSVAASVALVTTNPIWLALFEALFLKQRPGPQRTLGIALAVLGAGLIGLADASGESPGKAPLLGDPLALLGAWAVSGYLLLGQAAQRQLGTAGYVALAYPAAALVLLPLPWALGLGYLGHAPAFYLWLLLIAALPQLVGHTGINYAVRAYGPTRVALFILFEPLVAALAAFFLFGEVLPVGVLGGGALLLLGVGIAVRAKTA
jgi:drug/metabolite transporter (DMT)-like permease